MGGGVCGERLREEICYGERFCECLLNISISEKKLFEFYEKYLKIIFHGSTEKNIVHMQLF